MEPIYSSPSRPIEVCSPYFTTPKEIRKNNYSPPPRQSPHYYNIPIPSSSTASSPLNSPCGSPVTTLPYPPYSPPSSPTCGRVLSSPNKPGSPTCPPTTPEVGSDPHPLSSSISFPFGFTSTPPFLPHQNLATYLFHSLLTLKKKRKDKKSAKSSISDRDEEAGYNSCSCSGQTHSCTLPSASFADLKYVRRN